MALADLLGSPDNLLGLPPRQPYGGYQYDLPPQQAARQAMPQGAMPGYRPPSGIHRFLDSIGDALLVANGGPPIHRQHMQEAQAQSALQGFLTDPDQAIAQLMQVDAPTGIALYRAVHPPSETPIGIKEFEYARSNGYKGGYEDFVKLTHPALMSPVTMGPNDTIEGGGDTSGGGGDVTATNPTTGEKVRYNSQTGAWEPMGGSTASPPSGGFSVTARNNNPGALRVPGSKRFQSFANERDGVKAQEALLGRYLNRGLNNVSRIVETYAPRKSRGGDNTDAQVNNYIGYVARRLGVDPSAPLASTHLPTLAQAMREFETGKRAY